MITFVVLSVLLFFTGFISMICYQVVMRELVDKIPDSIKKKREYLMMFENPYYSNKLHFDILFGNVSMSEDEYKRLVKQARLYVLIGTCCILIVGCGIFIGGKIWA